MYNQVTVLNYNQMNYYLQRKELKVKDDWIYRVQIVRKSKEEKRCCCSDDFVQGVIVLVSSLLETSLVKIKSNMKNN